MIRLAALLILASLACKLLSGRWPWELLRADPRSEAESRARTLLGVGPRARREEIVAAHRRLVASVHPDRGGSAEQVHEADVARDLLLRRVAERGLGRERG